MSENVCQLDSPEILCGGGSWDAHYDHEQLEAITQALRSTCELGFEKVEFVYPETMLCNVSRRCMDNLVCMYFHWQ